ncbi:GNAT family N-acetyltransferase [Nocardioides euryhalodurans]|uniref:N-acetyltransferase n=1 Tax=Nocardioides euryhalodurans TaxID=2518370 RepID=A0A4P7GNS4_9ACTN|nr:GNAT family protein [Nocardioides euryhalodurans]QBR93876.1 N-acetyltransferase [Nocardioides euryhalodurans]
MTLRLRTDRLLLRPVDEDDLDVLLAIRNAPDVVATTSTGEPLPRKRMADQLSRRCKSWREQGLGSWLVLLEGDPVAYVEVAPIGEGSGVDPEAIEVGVVVHPDHWGKGMALEAGLAAARDIVDRLGLDRVYAGVDPDNEKSLRALAKVPGVRRLDDELYEVTAEALHRAGSPLSALPGQDMPPP